MKSAIAELLVVAVAIGAVLAVVVVAIAAELLDAWGDLLRALEV